MRDSALIIFERTLKILASFVSQLRYGKVEWAWCVGCNPPYKIPELFTLNSNV